MTMRCIEKSFIIYPGHIKGGFGWNLIQMKINPVQNSEHMKDFTKDKADSQTAHMRAKLNLYKNGE